MTKSTRLKALLANGYFPDELPPPFHTADLAKYRQSITKQWDALPGPYPKTIQENYSIPKITRIRRNLAIVNPIAQVNLCKLIADNWVPIRKHLKKRNYSQETPLIELTSGRAVPPPDFTLMAAKHAEISSFFDYALVSDISRFYGTLYTHAIPWALHGKDWCKTNLNKQVFRNSLGNRIDKAIRKGQDDQSVGIPVGPDTSRIISELVNVSIDEIIQRNLKLKGQQAFRQIDDWFIGFDTRGDAERAIAALASACHQYEMELNADKTDIYHASSEAQNLWPEELKMFPLETQRARQKQLIEHYFAKVFQFAKEFPNHNVLEFAVKRTRSLRLKQENWPTYEMQLIRAGRSNSVVIPTIVHLLASYRRDGLPAE